MIPARHLPSLEAAVRRLNAVVAVLDEDLRQEVAPLSVPASPALVDGPPTARVRAATAMQELERAIEQLERESAEADAKARDWQVKATIAREGGRIALADQADRHAAELREQFAEYAAEVAAARALIREWAQAVGGCPGVAD